MTVTITTPVSRTPYQRNPTTNLADITITGTYSGGSGALEASFNGSAYSTIVQSVSGGVYSGVLSAAYGQGTLTVRFANNTSDLATVTKITVTDIIGIWGQSNHVGAALSNTLEEPTPPTAEAVALLNNYDVGQGNDPIDRNPTTDNVAYDATPAGSYFPHLATRYMQCHQVPPAFIPCAKSGSQISEWLPGSDHSDRATLYGSGNYRLGYLGGRNPRMVLKWLGETNVVNGTSEQTFHDNLVTIARALATDKPNTTLFMCTIEDLTVTPWIGNTTNVNNAIIAVANEEANVVLGADFRGIDWLGAHYGNQHTWMITEKWWKPIKAHFGWSEPLVQSQKNTGQANTITVDLPLNTTSGNMIVVIVSQYAGTIMNSSSISDNRGNTYQLVGSVRSYTPDGQYRLGMYYAYNISGGATTITFSGSNNPSISLTVAEFEGVVSTSNPLDRNVYAQASSGTSISTGNTSTLSQADELVIAACNTYSPNSDPSTQGSGFIHIQSYEDGNVANTIEFEYKKVSSTDAVAGTFVHTQNTGWIAIAGTFKLNAVETLDYNSKWQLMS